MLDQSLLQSHFIGRDGFRWWIGQIPPIESMGKQIEGGGWGNRFKVRILGYHPYSEADLPNEDLPWAQVLIPTTSGSGAANCATGVQLQPGDVVLGFFLDGDNAQIPVILATFGRTDSVPSATYQSPFIPFTGFSSAIQKNKVNPSESNEVKSNSLPSPQDVSPEQADRLSPIFGYQVVSANAAIGDIIPLANTAQNAKTSKIKSIITNLIKKVRRLGENVQRIRDEIRKAAAKIVALCNEFIGYIMNTLITTLRGLLKTGLKLLYDLVYAIVLAATSNPVAAHLAGVAAQKAMVAPVKELEDSFSCVAGKVIDELTNVVVDIITSTIENVDRFVSCAADQFTGSLLNSIIDTIEILMSSPLAGVSKLLQFFTDFSVGSLSRSVIDGLGSASAAAFDCNQNYSNYQGLVNEWVVGGGPKYGDANPYSGIQNIVNYQNSGVDPNSVSECFSGALQFANPPIVNIFGGTGSGATAVPIFGDIVTNPDGNTTASIIGVQVTNPGSGYTFPPFVEIVDDAEQGYGAVARSLIDENGQVTSIYMSSIGENYSVGNISEYSVFDVIVENGGSGYVEGDVVVDNFGNEYKTQIVDGRIYQVNPLNNLTQSLPFLSVKTVPGSSGSGAILRPLLGNANFSGEVQKVVQCI